MLDEIWNYLRMSTLDQEDSPVTQNQVTEAFIREHNLAGTWTRTYFDLGISAGSVEKRPGIMALLTEAERLRPACIVFYKLDRAFRNAGEQSVALRRLKRLGIKVLKVRDPNLEGHVGDLIDGILGSVNEFERALVGSRIRDHNQTVAQQGHWAGGPPPFGYRYRPAVREQHGRKKITVQQGGLEPDPTEWHIARQLWDWALQGYRKSEIAELANAAGYRRRGGGLWGTDALSKMFLSRVYAGRVPYSQEPRLKARSRRSWEHTVWYLGVHQAMVSMDEWTKVQATTNSRMGQRRPSPRPRAELAGLIRCDLCSGPVVSVGKHPIDGYYYGCLAANRGEADHGRWIRSPWAVHYALTGLFDSVASTLPAMPSPRFSEGQLEPVKRELRRLQNQRSRLKELYVLGEFDDDLAAYQERARVIDAQIAANEAALAGAGPSTDSLLELWNLLRSWAEVYEATDSVRDKQRLWAAFVQEIRMSQTELHVRLRNLGPNIHREWIVPLPPPRSRRPGTKCGAGIVGMRGGGSLRSRAATAAPPRPVSLARD